MAEVGVITDRNDVRWLSATANKPVVAGPKDGTFSSTFVFEPQDSQLALNQ
jgi:hypothetical protein